MLKTSHIKRAARHMFICCDKEKAKCCSPEVSQRSWDFLKDRLRELKLVGPGPRTDCADGSTDPIKVLRSKSGCLQVCRQGPIAVVYPEGAWYHSCTPEVLEQIIQTHLIGGNLYEPNLFTVNNLNSDMALPMSDGIPADVAASVVAERVTSTNSNSSSNKSSSESAGRRRRRVSVDEADIFKKVE